MKHRNVLVVAFLALTTLVGCAQFQEDIATIRSVVSTAVQVKIPRKAIVLAVEGFVGLENTGTAYQRAYIKFPSRCGVNGATQPFCRDPAVHADVRGAILAGRAAADRLITFLNVNPTSDGPKADYDALIAAGEAIKGATAAWREATAK